MAELGYTTPLDQLPAWKSEAFSVINAEIAKIQDLESKKRGKRK